jgi:NADH-quinone oxidoreductase subunit J
VVYIGAIAILFIFAVMLTQRELLDKVAQENKNWPVAALIAIGTLAGLVLLTAQMPNYTAEKGALFSADPLMDLAKALVSTDLYVLPFEVASILLLAALVGSVYLASRK